MRNGVQQKLLIETSFLRYKDVKAFPIQILQSAVKNIPVRFRLMQAVRCVLILQISQFQACVQSEEHTRVVSRK